MSENGQEPVLWLSSQMALARINIVRDKADAAIEIARRGKITYESVFPNNFLADIFMTRLWLMLGDVSTAADYANFWSGFLCSQADGLPKEEALLALIQGGIYGNDIRNIWAEAPLLTYVRLRLAQGKLDGLVELLGHVHQDVESKQWKSILIETMILESLVFDARGETKAALQSLQEVLDLAEKENYLRVFIDEGLPMLQLLQRAQRRGIAPDYVSVILSAFKTPAAMGEDQGYVRSGCLPEPVTKREIEVLGLICDGLSNQDIAKRLYVSLSTVKSHIQNIYGKLDVNNRSQAIARAQEIGLLGLKSYKHK